MVPLTVHRNRLEVAYDDRVCVYYSDFDFAEFMCPAGKRSIFAHPLVGHSNSRAIIGTPICCLSFHAT